MHFGYDLRTVTTTLTELANYAWTGTQKGAFRAGIELNSCCYRKAKAKQSATMLRREREREGRETKAEMRARTAAHYALLLFLSIEIQ